MIPVPPFRLVTAPADACVTSVVEQGSVVAPGDVVAVLVAPRGEMAISTPVSGRIGGTLAGVDQRVVSGDGLVWIEP